MARPAGRGLTHTPPRPTPSRARLILRELGWEPQRDTGWWQAACDAAATVRAQPRERPTWDAGGAIVTVFDPGRPPSVANLVCGCAEGGRCGHVAATLLLLAFDDPARRPAFELPTWAVQLGPLVAGPTLPDAPEHAGEVRYVVEPPDPAGRLAIRPEVVRWSADGTRALRAVAYPGSREKLRSLVPVDDADLAFHDAWAAADEVRRRLKTPPERALSAALLEPLSRSTRVTFEGRSVTVATAPLAPRLRASLAEGALQLAWEPALAAVWTQGFALTVAGALHRLSERIPAATRQRLADPLPVIPPEDVATFVEKWAERLDVALPLELRVAPRPDAREARLVLSEEGATLHVRLALVQLRNGREEQGLVRDPGWEDAERARFVAEVGFRSLPMAEAADWLRDVLPGLRGRWIVYGEDGLVGMRVRGTLSPSVSFRGGEDGFTLDAVFTVEGRDVPPVPVLESWLRGLKYHRLDDGTIAALPEAWLARHGRALDALVRTRRLGSWHAWEASEITGGDPVAWVAAYRAGVPDLAPPEALRATLRPYQRAGQSWLRFLASHGLHGVLADDMGLGKTLQALAAILAVPGPALIVAPTSVLGVWMDEIARYTPLCARLYHGADRAPWGEADVVVTTYGLLRRDPALRARQWTWAVLDEAQAIKQPGSKVARAARALRAAHRLALTGTPVENDLTELWSLFAFLQPGYLGSRRSFHGRTAGPARRDTGSPVLAELRRTIRPFVLRRRKAEVAPELPSRTVVVQPVALSAAERALYESIRATYREADGKLHLLEVLTRLRQACCHPALLPFPEAREVPRSSKLRALLQRVREAVAGGHRMLVFSQWPTLLHLVGESLAAESIGFLLLEGRTTRRAELVARFQADGGPPVFLISTKAGGTGLTLTAAEVVVHLDPWWNPAAEDQATDRAHRIGQLRPVTVYKLVAEDTVEDRVLALQERKRALFEATLDADRDAPELAIEDWRALLA